MCISSRRNLHFNKRAVRSNTLQPHTRDENWDLLHTPAGARGQKGEGSALGAAGRVAAGCVASASMARAWGQRQERPQNILGICTPHLYITNMQIFSPHNERGLTADHHFCSGGFCITSVQCGLGSPAATQSFYNCGIDLAPNKPSKTYWWK